MKSYLFALLLLPSSLAFDWYVYPRYAHFSKRVSPDLFTGGLVTERQIEGLAAAGFKSIVSIAYEGETLDEFNGVVGPFPSSIDEIRIAASLGMRGVNINVTYNVNSLYEISTSILHMPKPVYFHCHAGYAASLFVILHEYLAGVVDGDDIYSTGLAFGWDFQSDESAVRFINDVTATDTLVASPSIELTLANGEQSYKYYYWSHRIDDNWFNIGQVLSTQVASIAESGYKSVISFRDNGEATTRLPSDPATGPVDNDEFSDDNGNYVVDTERNAFESLGLSFYNLPVTGESPWSVEQLDDFTAAMDEAVSKGPVLAHCTSGYRSSVYVIAYLGRQQRQCTHWALKEARRIGFSFDQSESDGDVVDFFEETLKC